MDPHGDEFALPPGHHSANDLQRNVFRDEERASG
jgi:hypothetical protein